MNPNTEMITFIFFYLVTCGVFIWIIYTIENDLDKGINEYHHDSMREFEKIHIKLNNLQDDHDKIIEVLRLRLDKLIEREKQLTFDSTNTGYHRELLKALTELKDIKNREKKLNKEIEEILQKDDP